MKFKSLLATLVVAFSMLFAACGESPVGLGGNDKKVSFDITISDINSSGATVNVEPSDKTVLYYFDKVTKSTYHSYKSDAEFTKAMIEALRAYTSTAGGSLVSALSVGNAEHVYSNELTPNTDYYIFAFTVDAKLNPTSAATLKAFTTENVKMSNNTFSISVKGGEVTVTPSNSDVYFWSLEPADLYAGETDEFIMNDLIAYYDSEGYLDYYLASGVSSFDYSTLLSVGESYTVYAFGYEGTPTTALTELTFTYGSGSGDYDSTTLTGDVTLNIAEVEAYYYGDYYEIGTNNWEIGFFNSVGNEYVYAEFFTVLNQKTPEGTYTITSNAGNANTAFSGAIEDGYILPTYYAKVDATTDDVTAFALIESGSFSVSKSGTNYSVSLNLSDALGNKVVSMLPRVSSRAARRRWQHAQAAQQLAAHCVDSAR